MDIVTYAAVNGITIEDAIEVLGSAGAPKGQNTEQEVFKFHPRLYYGPRNATRHYAGRGAARHIPMAYTGR